MNSKRPFLKDLKAEILVKTSRSSGPGGQNVNKVETRVQVIFNIPNSLVLSEEQKQTLLAYYDSKLSKEGDLQVSCDSSRSQLKNKELAFHKLDSLLGRPFEKRIPRKKTNPSKASKEKRLKSKKIQAEKKANRGKVI